LEKSPYSDTVAQRYAKLSRVRKQKNGLARLSLRQLTLHTHPRIMKYSPVTSSSIAEIGYDDEHATFGVKFRDGREYHYFGVPRDVFERCLGATSLGRYFNLYVKNCGYSFHEVG